MFRKVAVGALIPGVGGVGFVTGGVRVIRTGENSQTSGRIAVVQLARACQWTPGPGWLGWLASQEVWSPVPSAGSSFGLGLVASGGFGGRKGVLAGSLTAEVDGRHVARSAPVNNRLRGRV